ncbi:MAG: hypothetical protein GY861_18055 [bacterium]|nr:hypothetical protein [bacterium]
MPLNAYKHLDESEEEEEEDKEEEWATKQAEFICSAHIYSFLMLEIATRVNCRFPNFMRGDVAKPKSYALG